MNRLKILSLNPFTSIAIFLLLTNSLFVILSLKNDSKEPNQSLQRTEVLVRLPATHHQAESTPIPLQPTPILFAVSRVNPLGAQLAAQPL